MTWFINLPRWARLTIAFSVVAVVSVGGWLLTRNRTEVTFFDGAPVWDRVPLTVAQKDYKAPTKTAISLVNHAAGCKLFRMADPHETARVTVKPADGEPCGRLIASSKEDAAASAYFCQDGAEVHIKLPGDTRSQAAIIAHELGHVAGLGHDDWPGSLMYPEIGPILERKILMFSDRDGDALRERYCK